MAFLEPVSRSSSATLRKYLEQQSQQRGGTSPTIQALRRTAYCKTPLSNIQTPQRPGSDMDATNPVKRATFPLLHLDVRLLIYEHLFAKKTHDAYTHAIEARTAAHAIQGPLFIDQLTLGTQDVHLHPLILQYRISAHTKISLLLVNKTIYHEALPSFHRLHTFHMALRRISSITLPPPACLPPGIQHTLSRITRLELLHDRSDLDSDADWNVRPHLDFLRDCCPALRYLTVDLTAPFFLDEEQAGQILDSFHVLRDLWPLLEWLRVCMVDPVESEVLAHRDVIVGEEEGTIWCFDGVDQVRRSRGGNLDRGCHVVDRRRQRWLRELWKRWDERRGESK